MIHKDGKEIVGVYGMGRTISVIYKGITLVWEAIRSCFGKGYWVNDFGWYREEGWENNT